MGGTEEMVGRFVEYKRALGFDFSGEAQRLRSFAAYLGGNEATEDAALAWATQGAGHPRSYQAQRYETARRFSAFAHALDPSFPATGSCRTSSPRTTPACSSARPSRWGRLTGSEAWASRS